MWVAIHSHCSTQWVGSHGTVAGTVTVMWPVMSSPFRPGPGCSERAQQMPDDATRQQFRLNVGYAAKLTVQAVERLMPVVGGRGLELHNGFQRAWRDVHAVAQHIALVWDVQALNYASQRLGLSSGDPKI